MGDGAAMATGGEMLYRARTFESARKSEWERVLKPFESLLETGSGGRAAVEGKRRHDLAEKDLGVTRDCAKRVRELKNKTIVERCMKLESKVDNALKTITLREEAHRSALVDHQNQNLDDILGLCANYAAIIERECQFINKQAAEEEESHKRVIKELEEALAIEEFALHLEFETNNLVMLKRLPKDNPQYVRCRRAAMENVKSDFFAPQSNYSGIRVVDIFKVENKPMLRAFQKRAARLKSGSVKGLFCKISRDSLESIVVQGMQSHPTTATTTTIPSRTTDNDYDDYDDENGSGKTAAAGMFGRQLFTRSQLTPKLTQDAVKGPGFAEARYLESESMQFPTIFSRYSTLESDRRLMTQERPPKQESKTHYVALCRVIIGNVFFTSNDYKGFPSIDLAESKYDSMYSSAQEEYLMLNSEFVLPEFIIRFEYSSRYNEAKKKEEDAQLEELLSQALELDLSTPRPQEAEHTPLSTPSSMVMSSVVPRTVGLPGQGCDSNRFSEIEAKTQRLQLVKASEHQVGKQALHANAAKQREELWAKIANKLLNNK